MTKIAVIVSNPCTSDARVIKMAKAASEAGHEVHVFATAGKNTVPYEMKDGVAYHRLDWKLGNMLKKNLFFFLLGKVSRVLRGYLIKKVAPFVKYKVFSKLFAEHIAAIKPDIIHAHDLICLPTAFAAKEIYDTKIVYDAHELEVHRNPPLPFFQKNMVSHVEKKYGGKADAVITVGKLIAEVLSKELKRQDINVLYNSPKIIESQSNIRKDLNLAPEVPLVLYVGKVAFGRGIEEVLVRLPNLPGVHFVTVGPFDLKMKTHLQKLASKLELTDRFTMLPPVHYEQVVSYINGASLGLISVEPITLSYQYCMPNKLFELAFANVPILSNKLDEIEMFLEKFENGTIADFSDELSLTYNIYKAVQERDNHILTNENQIALKKEYSWDTQCEKLITIYKKALNSDV